jgi:hypothetical protein
MQIVPELQMPIAIAVYVKLGQWSQDIYYWE